MKNNEYWAKRFEQLEESLHQKAIDVFNQNSKLFEQTEKEINNQIAIWYQRFANNNEISITEAKKLLKSDELEELKWDIEEYIKKGRENALNQKWIKELENASSKFHISRLEALKIRIKTTVEQLSNSEEELLNTHLEDTYESSYYHNCFEVQKGIGIGFDIGTIDLIKLKKVLATPWASDEKNFSDRIWQSKTQLINELDQELTKMCILGKAPDEAIRNISKKLNVSRVQAGRLVMTESAFISSVAQKDSFNNLGVEEYEILAVLDSHTSKICQDLDGTVFPMSEYQVGSTAPPFHPNCRTTTIPHFDDEFDLGKLPKKTNDISKDMKYSEWKKKHVKNKVASKNYKDVTQKWLNNKIVNVITKNAKSIVIDGKEYFVNNKNKIIHKNNEVAISELIVQTFGGELQFLPDISEDKSIRCGDIFYKGEIWDIKELGKNATSKIRAIDNLIKASKGQSNNFIIDVTSSILNRENILKQIEKIYDTKGREWIDKIIVFDNNKLLKVIVRQK